MTFVENHHFQGNDFLVKLHDFRDSHHLLAFPGEITPAALPKRVIYAAICARGEKCCFHLHSHDFTEIY